MKKFYFLLLVCLIDLACFGEDYGILVNGTTYHSGTLNPSPLDDSFKEYMVLNLYLQRGDYAQLYDNENKAAWVVDLDISSTRGLVKNTDRYACIAAGCYDFYIKLKYGADQLYVGEGAGCQNVDDPSNTDNPTDTIVPSGAKKWATATPANCEDIMLQAFYWDSYSDKGYGNTQWATLLGQMEDIATYFEMVWLPPSAASSGGTGYHPAQFCNQNSDWGKEKDLKSIIQTCHNNNTKVIADVVLNHHWNKSSWCDFYNEDFGVYGTFQLTKQHICSDDEMWSNADEDCRNGERGNADTGTKYEPARDLDHKSDYVQQFSKAYLNYLQQIIGYDGFRWDVAKGFAASYFGQYITAAQPYFSVGEFFDYDYDLLKNWVEGTGKKSAVFDFACKKNAFHQAFVDGTTPNLENLIYAGQPRGLIGAEYKRYAVTFIDNHDTFERSDNTDGEFLGYKKSMTADNKTNLLMANAFLLSMPGIPCVFYPHWAKYKDEIKQLIVARKTAGIHNMSEVTVLENTSDKLIAEIKGAKGTMILKLGSGAGCNITPDGFRIAASGTNYALFVNNATPDYTPHTALSVSCSPDGGLFSSPQMVALTANKQGATIHYTLDGQTPTLASPTYIQPFEIASSVTLKIIAYLDGDSSQIHTTDFTFFSNDAAFTVAARRPDEWSAMYLYAWMNDGSELLGEWPGTTIEMNSNGWCQHTFEADQRPVNLIWNDGTNQTQNIENVVQTTCYAIQNNIATPTDDCPPITDDDTKLHNSYDAKTIDWTQPVYDVLGRPVSPQYSGIVIQQGKRILLNP